MATESKGFGLGSLVSTRFSSEPAAPAAAPEAYSSIGGAARPLITEDVEIKGELAFSGELEFNGRFEGTLESNGSLLVGERAIIKGGVSAESAVIAGKVKGDVRTTGKIHLRPEAVILGNITASTVVIEEGASVEGIVKTTQPRETPDFANIFTRLTSPAGKARPNRNDAAAA